MRRDRTPFRFENMWLKEEGFIEQVKLGGQVIWLEVPTVSCWLGS